MPDKSENQTPPETETKEPSSCHDMMKKMMEKCSCDGSSIMENFSKTDSDDKPSKECC